MKVTRTVKSDSSASTCSNSTDSSSGRSYQAGGGLDTVDLRTSASFISPPEEKQTPDQTVTLTSAALVQISSTNGEGDHDSCTSYVHCGMIHTSAHPGRSAGDLQKTAPRRRACSLTRPAAASCVDLPELDAFLHTGGYHGTLAGVALPIAGAQRFVSWGARLRWAEVEGKAGDGLHPAHCVQTVVAVFTRVWRKSTGSN